MIKQRTPQEAIMDPVKTLMLVHTYVTARQADEAGAKGAERRSQQRRSADRNPEEHTQRAGEPNTSAVFKT